MSDFMSYDPWSNITTRNGYAGDEMVAMLQKAIRADVADTFNMVSVDGDTSTNDMVTVLANGLALLGVAAPEKM